MLASITVLPGSRKTSNTSRKATNAIKNNLQAANIPLLDIEVFYVFFLLWIFSLKNTMTEHQFSQKTFCPGATCQASTVTCLPVLWRRGRFSLNGNKSHHLTIQWKQNTHSHHSRYAIRLRFKTAAEQETGHAQYAPQPWRVKLA